MTDGIIFLNKNYFYIYYSYNNSDNPSFDVLLFLLIHNFTVFESSIHFVYVYHLHFNGLQV